MRGSFSKKFHLISPKTFSYSADIMIVIPFSNIHALCYGNSIQLLIVFTLLYCIFPYLFIFIVNYIVLNRSDHKIPFQYCVQFCLKRLFISISTHQTVVIMTLKEQKRSKKCITDSSICHEAKIRKKSHLRKNNKTVLCTFKKQL